MKCKIEIIDENSIYLESVIELGDSNSGRLGHFPRGAFHQCAKNKQILVAINEDGNFLGYLLYNSNRSRVVYIVHLCIDPKYRGKGIAECLFIELKKITDNGFYDGIRVRCRRDYGIDNFWRKLGFLPRDEKSGRSKKGTTLTVWWYSYETPSLFSLSDLDKLSTKQKVVIDANVFFDLQNEITKNNFESHELLADWLQESIEICLTSEIYNEINRKEDNSERKKAREAVSRYTLIEEKNQDIADELRNFYTNPNLSDNDNSDLKHLEHTIASGIYFFLTRDEALQSKKDKIEQRFGVKILSPAHFITYLNELLSEREYQPIRLEGKAISFENVTDKYVTQLPEVFLAPQIEKKSDFNEIIKPLLVDVYHSEVKILKNHDHELLGLIVFCSIQQELEIPILRIKRNLDFSPTIAQFLVGQILQYATDKKKNVIKISDKYIVEDFSSAFEKYGFIPVNQEWYKINIYHVGNVVSLQPHLDKIKTYSSNLSIFIEEKLEKVLNYHKSPKNYLLPVEYALYPAKITDIEIPTFIVPIEPVWAMNLFDYRLQDLIGAKLNTLFSTENVYYRSSRQKIITAPSRVLWYVIKSDGKFQGTQSIRACSYIEKIHIDVPKNLFRKFKHLGIYKWRDVFGVAKNNQQQMIMAFEFTKTELFSNPLSVDMLKEIWLEDLKKSFNPSIQQPISIPNDIFYKLYQIGQMNSDKNK
jgi:predicted nucleic acid-binding protein/ribosomal protein S18 acetylase RimI-like enzyme